MDKCYAKCTKSKDDEDGSKTMDELSYFKRPLSPARELLVWEKWMRIRKEEATKLGNKVKREPVDLAMNLLTKVREDKERKTALEHAQIEKKPCARGSFFESGARLKQCCDCAPVYEVHRTPAELGVPAVIEYVSVPKQIQETELGMSGEPQRETCPLLNADYKNYRKKREEKLAKKLRKIDPFRPSASKLMIQGHKPKQPPPKLPPVPTIVIDDPPCPSQDTISGVYAVRINKSVWYRESPSQRLGNLSAFVKEKWHEDCTSWTYYFNVPIKRIGRGKLFLHNLGTVTLRYHWRQVKQLMFFVPKRNYEQVFFFNKNEDVLSPGQCKDLRITFVSEKPGMYSEFWELVFSNVCFFDSITEKIYINLYADATENAGEIKRKVEVLKTRIHRKSLSNLVREFVNEIIDKVFAVIPQSYPYKKYFLEAEIFLMKNPVCFYHQTEVAKMSEMYNKEMKPGETWDLAISSWREVMMSKDYDGRMKYYDALKKFHSELLKPWYEGDELLKRKHHTVNYLLGQLANMLDKEYQRLTDLHLQIDAISPRNEANETTLTVTKMDPLIKQKISNMFYLHAYGHVASTIEQCAGMLSSIDSDRWIEFDFCRS